MSHSLANSVRICQQYARQHGRNFYWSFLTLPRAMRRDMCVLYTFMQMTDFIGDRQGSPIASRRFALDHWRTLLTRALQAEYSLPTPHPLPPDVREDDVDFVRDDAAPIFPAVADLVARRRIPAGYLYDVIDGVQSDQVSRSFETFTDLEAYCYQVAGAVGLCCIHVWGFQGEEARKPAVDCGTAFQLTNILRDLQEDAQQGRVYLPQEDLRRFGVTVDDLQSGRLSDRFRQLMEFEIGRAQAFYEHGSGLLPHLSPEGRRIQSAMLRIYGGLLDEIVRRKGDVFSSRVELPSWRKLSIAVSSCLKRW